MNSLNVSAQGYYNQNPQYFVWHQTGTVGLAYDSGYGFISDEPWQLGFSLGVNTRLVQNLYLGTRVGYNGVFVNASGVESDSHFLTIPVKLGYALTFGEDNYDGTLNTYNFKDGKGQFIRWISDFTILPHIRPLSRFSIR